MTTQKSEVKEDFSDLFVDNNLLDVFRASPSILTTPINRVVTVVSFLLLSSFALLRWKESSYTALPAFVSTFALWATIGWTLSSTLLGFLVAGFALLSTVLRPSALVALHQYPDEHGTNMLRGLFIFFVDIFITFLLLLIFSIIMAIITSDHGPFIEIRKLLHEMSPRLPSIVGLVIYVLWATWFIAVVLKLKSFVYNLYQALLIGMTESVHSSLKPTSEDPEQSAQKQETAEAAK